MGVVIPPARRSITLSVDIRLGAGMTERVPVMEKKRNECDT